MTFPWLVLSISVCFYAPSVSGHGRMIEPPMRSSMFRFGFDTPKNWDDNELNCGGYTNQYENQKGKCGVCGDPYQGPRENEAGGKYARGIIVRSYQPGTIINSTLDITSNHHGYIEFRLCPVNDPKMAATHKCLDKHLLHILGSGTRYTMVETEVRLKLELRVQLPAGLTCKQCVLQMMWVAAQHNGRNGSGKECFGCGPQEHFINCADISIGDEKVTALPPLPEQKPGTYKRRMKSGKIVEYNVPGKNTKMELVLKDQAHSFRSIYRHVEFAPPHTTVKDTWLRDPPSPTTVKKTWHRDPTSPTTAQDVWYRTTPTAVAQQSKHDIFKTTTPYPMTYPPTYPTTTFSWWWGSETTVDPDIHEHGVMVNFPVYHTNDKMAYPVKQQNRKLQVGLGAYLENARPKDTATRKTITSSPHRKIVTDPPSENNKRHFRVGIPTSTPMPKTMTSVPEVTTKATRTTTRSAYIRKCPDGSKPKCQGVEMWGNVRPFDEWCSTICPMRVCPSTMCDCWCPGTKTKTNPKTKEKKCSGLEKWKDPHGSMDRWCATNCRLNNCPSRMCICI